MDSMAVRQKRKSKVQASQERELYTKPELPGDPVRKDPMASHVELDSGNGAKEMQDNSNPLEMSAADLRSELEAPQALHELA